MRKPAARQVPQSSLGFRLGSTLALALLPLGALSIIQAQGSRRDLEASTLDAVAGASLRAAQAQIDLIKDAQITARTFAASLAHSLEEGAPCAARAKSVAATIPEASLVGYVPMSGLMTCSSTGAVRDLSSNSRFQMLTAEPVATVYYNPVGSVTGVAIVGIVNPVVDADGRQLGIVTISLPYTAITPADFAEDIAGWRPQFLAAITADGRIVVASEPDRNLAGALPATVSTQDLPGRAGTASFENDANGRHLLSVTAVAQDLFLVSVWQGNANGLLNPWSAAAPYLLPGLTWIAAFAVAGFASSRLVVRHVRALSRSMADYLSSKNRMMVPDVADAPAEIQRLHEAYGQLVRTIEQEEAELQNLIVDKDILLREVNHRSGNSLQIIASVMRMYRREAQDPALQGVLDGMINRVIALSSTHTSLYGLSGQRDVPLDTVLSNVLRRLKEIHRIPVGTTERRLQSIRTDAQMAVGVAMAVAEAVSAFFTAVQLVPGQISIALEGLEDRIVLQISGPAVPELQDDTEKGIKSLPRRMLKQFSAQLDGKLQIETSGDRSTVTIDFPNASASRGT